MFNCDLLHKSTTCQNCRRIRWAGHVAHIGEERRDVVVKPEGQRPLCRLRSTQENYIGMDLQDIGEAKIGLIWLWILTFGGLL